MFCDLNRHLKAKDPDKYKIYEDFKKHSSRFGFSSGQRGIDEFIGVSDNSYQSNHPCQKLITNSVVENLIVRGGVPIAFVECEGFLRFMADIDQKYVAPSHKTVTSTILPRLVQQKKERVRDLLTRSTDIALTIDIWTDRRQHSFIGMTAHSFDVRKGTPQSCLLKFKSFKGSHTGQSISESIEEAIVEYGLQEKVRYIVSDNASNMKKAMSFIFVGGPNGDIESWFNVPDDSTVTVEDNESELDDPTVFEDVPEDELNSWIPIAGERLPCFAHSLQLTVRDGL